MVSPPALFFAPLPSPLRAEGLASAEPARFAPKPNFFHLRHTPGAPVIPSQTFYLKRPRSRVSPPAPSFHPRFFSFLSSLRALLCPTPFLCMCSLHSTPCRAAPAPETLRCRGATFLQGACPGSRLGGHPPTTAFLSSLSFPPPATLPEQPYTCALFWHQNRAPRAAATTSKGEGDLPSSGHWPPFPSHRLRGWVATRHPLTWAVSLQLYCRQ